MNDSSNNAVTLCGELTYTGESYEDFGERFYFGTLTAKRLSGTTDTINLVVPECIRTLDSASGGRRLVTGSLRSRNVVEGERLHVLLSVFVSDVSAGGGWTKDKNEIELTGNLCKLSALRVTPSGRQIADLLLAVPRNCGRSDYIPAIAWGRNARFAQSFPIGSKIRAVGRIQSRTYSKRRDDGSVETLTAYEV